MLKSIRGSLAAYADQYLAQNFSPKNKSYSIYVNKRMQYSYISKKIKGYFRGYYL
jgi:hypothetical protein